MKQHLDLIKSVAHERRLTHIEQKLAGDGMESAS